MPTNDILCDGKQNKLKKRMRNLSKQAKLKLARAESPSASASWDFSEASSEAGRNASPSQEDVSSGHSGKEGKERSKGSELLKDIRLVDEDDGLFDDDESDFCRVPSFPEMSSAPPPGPDADGEWKDESSEEQALGVLEDITVLEE